MNIINTMWKGIVSKFSSPTKSDKKPIRTAESNTFEYQYTLTNKIINALNDIGHEAYLAGGAPRDWHLGNPIIDLDFYVLGDTSNVNSFRSMEQKIDECLENMLDISPEPFFTDRYDPLAVNLQEVFDVTFVIKNFYDKSGLKIQLMVTNKIVNIEHIVSAFSCSICEYYYDAKKNMVLTSDLNLNYLKNKSVLVSYREKNSDHIVKMKERFPEYKFLAFPYQIKERSSTYQQINVGGDL